MFSRFCQRNPTVILGVWAAVGPFLTAIMTHYFGSKRNDTGWQ